MKSFDSWLLSIAKTEFEPGADRITVGARAISFEKEGDEMISVLQSVFEETNSGCGAVGDPVIEVAVKIPIDCCNGSRVISEVPADGGRNVGEASVVSATV